MAPGSTRFKTPNLNSDRKFCRYCLRTLNLDDSDSSYRTFVECPKCGTAYHERCRKAMTVCTAMNDDEECGATSFTPVEYIEGQSALTITSRVPIRFKGLDAAPKQQTQPNTAGTPSQAAPSTPSGSPVVAAPPVVAAVGSSGGVLLTPRPGVRAVARFLFLWIGLVIGVTPFYFLTGQIDNRLLIDSVSQVVGYSVDYIVGQPIRFLIPAAIQGLVLAIVMYLVERLRQQKNRALYLVPPIVGVVGLIVSTTLIRSITDGIAPYSTLLPILIVTVTFWLTPLIRPVLLRMFVAVAAMVGPFAVTGDIGRSSPVTLAFIGLYAVCVGALPWIPDLFWRSPSGSQSQAYSRRASDSDTARRMIFRTLAMAIPGTLLVASVVIPVYQNYRRYCDQATLYQVLESVVPVLIVSLAVSAFVMAPAINSSQYRRNFFGGLIITGVISGVAGGVAALAWSAIQDMGRGCLTLTSYQYNSFQNNGAIVCVVGALMLGGVMWLSTRTGYTRLNHTVMFARRIGYLIVALGLIVIVASGGRYLESNLLIIGITAIATGIGIAIPVGVVWLADYFGAR